MDPARAYVTFLAGNGDDVKGVVGLAKGLRKVQTTYPLVVAVLPDVPEEHRRILKSLGCIIIEIEPVFPPGNQTQFGVADDVNNFSKILIWKFVQYSKMIYLNPDIQVFDNIDELFDYPDGAVYAVLHCFCEDTEMMNTARDCQEELYFNHGMLIFEPNEKTSEDLLHNLNLTQPTRPAWQDYLNMFFKDSIQPISSIYNLQLAMLWSHPEKVVDVNRAKVVNYCVAGSKPWRYTGKEENMDTEDVEALLEKWWEVYND